ncbi:MAG: cob(I)yrinic acid a,c-diamide adenosyltransferase [Spirochaetota bacterium]
MQSKQIILVYTGNGKGKTTAALGTVFRALGHDMRCGVLQFIKQNPSSWGEYKSAVRSGVTWENFGCGFTWEQEALDESQAEARRGWERAKQVVLSQQYDLVVLDEFSYPHTFGWLDAQETVSWLETHREKLPHLIMTGRNMPEELISLSDTVSEISEVKHHFSEGVRAAKGIEF